MLSSNVLCIKAPKGKSHALSCFTHRTSQQRISALQKKKCDSLLQDVPRSNNLTLFISFYVVFLTALRQFGAIKRSPSWSLWTKTWGIWCCSNCTGRDRLCGRMCGTGCRPLSPGAARGRNHCWAWARSASKQARRRRGTAPCSKAPEMEKYPDVFKPNYLS